MGLDLLDLTYRIEKAFHINVGRDEFSQLVRDHDIAVGDIYEFILGKMNLRDVARYSFRLNEFVWLEMRSAIHLATETPPEQIHLSLPLRTTVKDLCRGVLATNYADLCNACEIAHDAPCSAVWEQLVELLVEVLGVDPAVVTFRSRLFRDLGAS
jgi:acyl carrier protein